MSALHPDVARLAAMLGELAELLRRHDMRFLAGKLDLCRKRLENADFYGVTSLLEQYAGRDSLNDIILVGADQAQLLKLLGDVWRTADKLRAEYQEP